MFRRIAGELMEPNQLGRPVRAASESSRARFKACKEAGEDAAKQSEQLRKALSTVKGPLSFVFH